MLNDCYERVFCDFYYTENELGLQMVQGNSVCLVSDIVGFGEKQLGVEGHTGGLPD